MAEDAARRRRQGAALAIAVGLRLAAAGATTTAGAAPAEAGATPQAAGATPQAAATPEAAGGVETESLYLSGRAIGDGVRWDFEISDGRRGGERSSIEVPSNWELQGFGTFAYGLDEDKPREQGLYRHRFALPREWRGRRLQLVFEGVMTDATVTLNGRSAGPTHRGGFTEFRYEVTDLVRWDRENELEVLVAKHSSNPSVNRAERDADYWVFGGIFRPVRVEARPTTAVERLAIDATADGLVTTTVEVASLDSAGEVGALEAAIAVVDDTGRVLASSPPRRVQLDGPTTAPQGSVVPRGVSRLELQVPGADPWSAETPHLYDLIVELRAGGRALHRERRRIGFRSVELRTGPNEVPGLYVNGSRVLLKGINRHSFWPETGRALPAGTNRRDAELIRSLNLNAVRSSHYPPDRKFLEVCDELGLYVIDELPGWADAYDTGVGAELVREMVVRDQHHPSIILWANGNEEGWNSELDSHFGRWDPQDRPVLHPDRAYGRIFTSHYPTWEELVRFFDDDDGWLSGIAPRRERRLVLFTEMLHGLYDGGGGSGLELFWSTLRRQRRFMGFFLWTLLDEGVVRADVPSAAGVALDTRGSLAADGIFDPYRRPEPSARAVREILAPVVVVATQRMSTGVEELRVLLENRYDHLDLDESSLFWEWLELPQAASAGAARALAAVRLDANPASGAPRQARAIGLEAVAEGEGTAPSAAPGERAWAALQLPPGGGADVVRLSVLPPGANGDRARWSAETVLPVARRIATVPVAGAARPLGLVETEEGVELSAGDVILRLDSRGELLELSAGDRPAPLRGGGPSMLLADSTGEKKRAQAAVRTVTRSDRAIRVEFRLERAKAVLTWLLRADGWARFTSRAQIRGDVATVGLRFELDPASVRRMLWLGRGPHRVWSNRRTGRFDLWQLDLEGGALASEAGRRSLAGLYDATWLRLDFEQGSLWVQRLSDELVGVGRPSFPEDARNARTEVPEGLSILSRAPSMGTKFRPGTGIEPRRDDTETGFFTGGWFYFEPALAIPAASAAN